MNRFRVGLFAVITAGTCLTAQSPPSQPNDVAAFEVVSIKPVASRVPLVLAATCVVPAGARFTCVGATLQGLITWAYRLGDAPVRRWQIVGGPDWITTSQFQINALVPAADRGRLSERLPDLLRPVLEDRFRLAVHVERRAMTVYALVPAFEDRRVGPQLRRAATSCAPIPIDAPSARPPRSTPDEKMCWGGNFQLGHIRAGAITMGVLAEQLTNGGLTDRIVLDRTDLSGPFELDLRWSPDVVRRSPDSAAANVELLDQPSLFTAVREQLGLKLEPRTEDMDVLVIDQAELPTPN